MEYNTVAGNGISISVQHFPDRKRPSLCVEREGVNCIHVLASFNSEEKAELFITMLANLCGAVIQKEE